MEKEEKKEEAKQLNIAKLEAVSPMERASLLSAKVLKSGSAAREFATQLKTLDADIATQEALFQYAKNCDENHAIIQELVSKKHNTEESYQEVTAAAQEPQIQIVLSNSPN